MTDGVTLKMADVEVWGPTPSLRWYRPPGGTDADMELQQAWKSQSMVSKIEWRPIPVVLGD